MNENIIHSYQSVRQTTEKLCAPLEVEDYVVQSIADTSPPKWHLAHTTWFFETFLLIPYLKNYQIFDASFNYLFNSYYQSLNEPFPRAKRGVLSRPTVKKIFQYRHYVNQHLDDLITSSFLSKEMMEFILLGFNHEQQHQELLLMDIKHNFYQDKNFPVYRNSVLTNSSDPPIPFSKFIHCEGGLVEIGNHKNGFCFDNELPRHSLLLKPFLMASHLTTNKEFLAFIEDGGYSNPIWWLSDGWDCVIKHKWEAPLYWQKINNSWHLFTLNGLRELILDEPVVHVSYYEADAFARWAGKRLPLEMEWEFFVEKNKMKVEQGNFLEDEIYHPRTANASKTKAKQLFGDVWEWTASAYSPYPGYVPLKGALGEYNGKFMSNQFVLRGGSCATPRTHIRASYRNFFQPDKRWAFSGIRLAENA